MNAQNKSKGKEDYPNWYDIKIFPGSLDEFRELYGKNSELVKMDGPLGYIRGRYFASEDTNRLVKKLKDRGITDAQFEDKIIVCPEVSLVKKLRELQADGIVRAREIKVYSKGSENPFIEGYDYRYALINLHGIPVRSEEMKKGLEGRLE